MGMKLRNVEDITLSINFTSLGLSLFLISGIYYNFISSFSFGSMLVVACCGAVIMLIALPRLPQMASRTSMRMLFWIGAVVIICINNGYLEHGYLAPFFSLPLAVITAYSLQYNTGWHQQYLKIFRFLVLSNFVIAWILWLLPGLYVSKVVPLFSVGLRGDLIRWSNQHVLMGLMAHYSASGVFFAYSVIFYAASWLSKEQHDQDLTMLLLMMISLMMTQKRGPLLFAVATVVFLYFLANHISFDKMMKFGLSAVAAVVFLVLVIQFLPDMQKVIDRFFEDGDVTNGRSELYANAIALFKSHKLLGIGWGQYRFTPGSKGLQVHNIYLQILAETGIIGAVFLYSGFGAALFSTIQNIFEIKKNAPDRIGQCVPFPILFSAAMQIYFVLYGMTGNPIYDMMCIYPYFLSVAINESYSVEKHSRAVKKENKK